MPTIANQNLKVRCWKLHFSKPVGDGGESVSDEITNLEAVDYLHLPDEL
jgi:hypothetical protein